MKLVFEGSREELLNQVQIINSNFTNALQNGDCIISTNELLRGTIFEFAANENYGLLVYPVDTYSTWKKKAMSNDHE